MTLSCPAWNPLPHTSSFLKWQAVGFLPVQVLRRMGRWRDRTQAGPCIAHTSERHLPLGQPALLRALKGNLLEGS